MALFRGFVAASGSYVYWSSDDPTPGGVSFITQLVATSTEVAPQTSISSAFNPTITSGLSHDFRFTEGKLYTGLSAITDSVGGITLQGGPAVGTSWVPAFSVSGGFDSSTQDRVISAINIDSDSDAFTNNDALTKTGSLSVEFVAYPTVTLGSTTWDFVVGNHRTTSPRGSWEIFRQGSGAPNKILWSSWFNDGVNFSITSSNTWNINEWKHIVCTREVVSASLFHVTKSIYFNSVVQTVGSVNSSSPIYPDTDAANNFYIGRNGFSGDFFQGGILFVRIYDRVLTPTEIATAYSSSLREWQTKFLLD